MTAAGEESGSVGAAGDESGSGGAGGVGEAGEESGGVGEGDPESRLATGEGVCMPDEDPSLPATLLGVKKPLDLGVINPLGLGVTNPLGFTTLTSPSTI